LHSLLLGAHADAYFSVTAGLHVHTCLLVQHTSAATLAAHKDINSIPRYPCTQNWSKCPKQFTSVLRWILRSLFYFIIKS